MKERPILFSAPMVRAILDGRKTQTRRIMKPQPILKDGWFSWDGHAPNSPYGAYAANHIDPDSLRIFVGPCSPYGKPGDRLWVRETFCWSGYAMDPDELLYRADQEYTLEERGDLPWKPSIFMPRWASRILLEIVSIRVERLQDISEADAKAEGAPGYEDGVDSPPPEDGNYSWSYAASFRDLWKSINGPESWQGNPWVWVIEFKRVES